MSEVETTSGFEGLADAKYVCLTTFRRNGTPVATPLWCAVDDGVVYAWTGDGTGKVKRIRNEPRVTVCASNGRGAPTGPVYAARARLLAGDEGRHAYQLLTARYRTAALVYGFGRLLKRLRRSGEGSVGIAVEASPTVDLPTQG